MCVVHDLHRVCETIHVLYPNVDNLVANRKKILVKSPARTELFKNKAPDTLLPTPVITHWGTWLDAIVYYAENFKIFCSVVNELERDDASSVALLQDIFKDSNELRVLKSDLGLHS
jgi:hypothetical protein